MDMPEPYVIMVVGVNGVGKTTTVGKIAALYRKANKQVLIGAADTFRAAATEQIDIWASRSQADIVKHQANADPAAVSYDSIEAAIARKKDIVLIDTAGRLHTQVNLMEELKKIKRVITKRLPGAPHEILLILDATTGQNALSQAELFNNALGITDIALTKLDGTAKGGIAIAIGNTFGIPLKYIGVGEALEDMHLFNPQKFMDALFW
jgi:fused signal recognition particle receptor